MKTVMQCAVYKDFGATQKQKLFWTILKYRTDQLVSFIIYLCQIYQTISAITCSVKKNLTLVSGGMAPCGPLDPPAGSACYCEKNISDADDYMFIRKLERLKYK